MQTETKPATIRIDYDDTGCESPRDWDNIGTLFVPDNRYVSGDKGAESPTIDVVPDADIIEWACANLDKSDLQECARNQWDKRNGYTKADAVRATIEKWYSDFTEYPESLRELVAEHCIIVPVYAYVHSGVALSTGGFSCPWDSGCVGLIWCTFDRAREEYGDDAQAHERARKYLIGEIETLDTYYRGNVYGFTIEDADGEHVDSCWGFYGSTIDECGILDHIDESLHDAARRAFDDIGQDIDVSE